MSIELTPMELLTRKMIQLEDKQKAVDAAIKAGESRLKDIRSQYDLADVKVKYDLEQLELEQYRKRDELLQLIGPLQGQIDALHNKVASAQRELDGILIEKQAVLDDRRAEMASLDSRIKEKQETLASIEREIQSTKAKVATL